MGRLTWDLTDTELVAGLAVPTAAVSADQGHNQGAGVKRYTPGQLRLRRAAWPAVSVAGYVLTDGFLTRHTSRLVRRYVRPGLTFLDVGCGDMRLRRALPDGVVYNGFDLQLSELHVSRAGPNVNVAVASATDIPLPTGCVDVAASVEVLEHIPGVDSALGEISRVVRPGGVLLGSIPNNHCRKYQVKGPHPGHVNDWTFDGFLRHLDQHGFDLIEGYMIGRWVPFPTWLTKLSVQIPMSSAWEADNTNFVFAFRRRA